MKKSSNNKTLATKHAVLVFSVLVVAGLAANYFKYELFFNIQFIFGSVFALLALQVLGLAPGILAALLISSITYPLWNHPYAIVIMTAEVISVGILCRRKGVSVILADAIYWLGLGMPMVYVFYHGIMKLTQDNTLVTMVKQSLNGITNALFAGVIFMTIATLWRWRRFSFQEVIFHLLALFMLCPSLLFLTLDSRSEFSDTDQAIRASLIHSSDRITHNLDQWLQGHGYTIGVLNPHGLQKIIEIETQDQGIGYTLLDKNGKVIVSNNPTLKPMDTFARGSSVLQQFDDGVSQWIPNAQKNISISARWQKSSYIKETTFGDMAEWKLILEQPVAPFQAKLFRRFAKKLAILMIILILAMTLAEFISRKAIRSLERLSQLSNNLPQKMLDAEEIVWPESSVLETANLLANFKDMANVLRENFTKIHLLNTNLESTIQERTREAQQIASRYQTLMSTATDGIHVFDLQGNMIEANEAFSKMLGYSQEEVLQLNILAWDVKHSPEEIEANIQKILQGPAFFTTQHRCKNGEIRDIEISASRVLIDGQTLIFNTSRDITERKQAEEIMRRSVKEKEVMLKEIHHRVKNNMQVVYSLLNLQARNSSDSVVRTMFEESRNRISSMALIHEKLYRSADLSHIDFKEYVQSLIAEIASTYNRHDIVFAVDIPTLQFDINIGIPCGLIINELVSNSLKHAFPEGRKGVINISINTNRAGTIALIISDNGIGFPTEIDYTNTTSLGMQLIIVLTSQLNGTVALARDEGTKFTITFPAGEINQQNKG